MKTSIQKDNWQILHSKTKVMKLENLFLNFVTYEYIVNMTIILWVNEKLRNLVFFVNL